MLQEGFEGVAYMVKMWRGKVIDIVALMAFGEDVGIKGVEIFWDYCTIHDLAYGLFV